MTHTPIPLELADSRTGAISTSVVFTHYATGGPSAYPPHADVEIAVFISDDGTTVVQIDTHGDDRLRINVNDSTAFDRGVETGQRFEEDQ